MSLALSQCPVAKLLATYMLLPQYYGDTEAADWPYWMRTTVLESRNVDSSKYIPKVPYSSSFTATCIVKGSPLAPNVPTLSLASPWGDAIVLVIVLHSVAHWGNDLRECIPWPLIQVCCYVDWNDMQAWIPQISFAGGHVISFKTCRIHFAGFTCFNVTLEWCNSGARLCNALTFRLCMM